MMRTLPLLAIAGLLSACATPTPAPDSPANSFFARLSALCGKAFAGRVGTDDRADAAFAGKSLIMHVRVCSESEIRIPFHVGDDRSRTWVVTRTATGLRLKHDHRHADGSEDPVTQYGGNTAMPGIATRQEFPVDAFSKRMFERESLAASVTNVWAIEVEPGMAFVYELARPGRRFRVRFDLSRPVAAPPPPWGAAP